VPIVVFALGAVFATPLWLIECDEVQDGVEDDATATKDEMCSFYEWWKYILGNLVGLGSPLTPVGPESGHMFAEVVDLLIAIWSLSVAGLVIGLLGSLAWVNVVTESADERISGKFDRMIGFEDRVRDAIESKSSSMDFTAFSNLCKEQGMHINEAALREVFKSADADGSGFIEKSEVESLLAKVRDAEQAGGSSSSTGGDIHTRMDEMDSKFQSRMDMVEAKLDEILSRIPG